MTQADNLRAQLAERLTQTNEMQSLIDKLIIDNKAKNGTIASLRGRNGYLKKVIKEAIDIMPNTFDKRHLVKALEIDSNK